MARLLAPEISQEIRESLAEYDFTNLELVSIPTGKDPRFLADAEADYPMAIVKLASSMVSPAGLGGGATGIHGFAIYIVFLFGDDEDVNLMKLQYGQELFEWLCSAREGTNYKILMTDEGQGQITFDYEPQEESYYLSGSHERPNLQHIGMMKMEAALTQKTTFSIKD